MSKSLITVENKQFAQIEEDEQIATIKNKLHSLYTCKTEQDLYELKSYSHSTHVS
jgi:hypothetical protein